MKKVFIGVLALVTLTVVGVSCGKNNPEKADKCVCDITYTENGVTTTQTAVPTSDCKVGRTSKESGSKKDKDGNIVKYEEVIKCYSK